METEWNVITNQLHSKLMIFHCCSYAHSTSPWRFLLFFSVSSHVNEILRKDSVCDDE